MSEEKVNYAVSGTTLNRGFRACCCTLPPECCIGCPNNGGTNLNPLEQYKIGEQPIRETVEEFDKEGHLIKRTVYEKGYQWIPLPYTTTITGGRTSCESDTTLKMSDTPPQDNQIRT